MTLPLLFGQPLLAWSGPAAFVVALGALVVALTRRRPRTGASAPDDLVGDRSADLERRVSALERSAPAAIQHAALVRFDAFPGAGGQFSFSAALLDEAHSGLLLTAIAGRAETRMYAKWVERGRAVQPLSPEEEAALERAFSGSVAQREA